MNNSYAQQVISVDGTDWRYTIEGSGNAVFVLQPVLNNGLIDQLASNFRVIAVEIPDSDRPSQGCGVVDAILKQLSINKYCLISESELATAGIAHAVESGDALEALVLIAPVAGVSNGASGDFRLEEVSAPTLVLFGTRDQIAAPETGRVFARRIPKCFYSLVYDAGHDIARDRPHALVAVVRDFLQRREKFVVQHESSMINP